ncbi:hypothetical protein H5203_20470 [Pseudoalteromonas sp. SG41-1]|uniref:hypothetical protein n=1 Tax=Pseudoalteromonas sp. SG41-1 TaxID=2760979 RepID=UPI0016049588|nr:hypothetical protein [Pseudoalteromonas sp. SG41-1]MBB1507826.1 hypothetical protein [Pseudoalteromonas sp. SG41-1]
MLKQLVVASSLIIVSGCDDNVKPKQSKAAVQPYQLTTLEHYQHQANNLLRSIRVQKDAANLETQSADLVALSQTILNDLIVDYPQCAEYINALIAVADLLPSLPLEEIESGYHSDGKLPKFDDPICYHGKDLLVHPATVQAVARLGFVDPQAYEYAELGIIEVIAHFDQVEQALNK